ncbi:SHOCT domain-containing protein [Halomontanus rarus]|uniref:SHOCT domain-containing protein n=1 Tax=Halomontanus rarus TaxID=3034020 RepID=UPI0023E76A88|nr:SHOCT domain-containing protein [Halovivax sp. TS33]
MEWTDRTSMLGLILSLSLGFCTLFVLASDFFGSFFEFLGIASLVLGWFIVAPAYYFLTRAAHTDGETATEAERASGAETTTPTDPMDTLRRRYAAGDISEAEFERKLERLLETEGRSPGDSSAGPPPNATSDDRIRDELDRELEREREHGYE